MYIYIYIYIYVYTHVPLVIFDERQETLPNTADHCFNADINKPQNKQPLK